MYHAHVMPTTFDRYIIREIAVPFFLGMAAFTAVLLMGRFLKIADMVVAKGVPIADIALLIAYLFPSFALVTIPMAFLLAILLAFGRLSADSEIVAIKASGVSLTRLLLPVLACAALATVATAIVAVYAVPWGNTSFKGLLTRAVEQRAEVDLRERVFVDSIPGLVIYVDRFDPVRQTMTGVMIQDQRDEKAPLTIFARQGNVTVHPGERRVLLNLTGGSIHRSLEKEGYRLIQFRDYVLNVQLPQTGQGIGRNELDMSLDELRAGVGSPATSDRIRREMELEFHRRFSTPFACFVFAIAGVPLGVQNRRSGKGGGFAVSIGLLLLYYVILSACKTLGERGLVPAVAAMWGPNIFFLALGVWFFRRAVTERPIFGGLSPIDLASSLWQRITGQWLRK